MSSLVSSLIASHTKLECMTSRTFSQNILRKKNGDRKGDKIGIGYKMHGLRADESILTILTPSLNPLLQIELV